MVIRKLSPTETYYLSSQVVNPLHIVQAVELDTVIDENQMRTAFLTLIESNPILATKIQGRYYPNACLVECELNSAQIFCELTSEGEITQLFEDELKDSLSIDNGPLVRLKYLKKGQRTLLLFSVHHIICDGVSAKTYLKELLTNYFNDLPIKAKNVVPESMEAHLHKPFFAVFSMIGSIAKQLTRKRFQFTKLHAIPFENRETVVRSLKFEGIRHDLENYLKKENVGVSVFLSTILAKSIFLSQKTKDTIDVGMPVDMRRKIGLAKDAHGCYVASVAIGVKEKAEVREMTQQFKSDLKTSLKKKRHIVPLFFLNQVLPKKASQDQAYYKTISKNSPGHIALSFLGDIQDVNPFIRAYHIGSGLSIFGAFYITGTWIGETLHLSVFYIKDILKEKEVDSVLSNFSELMSTST